MTRNENWIEVLVNAGFDRAFAEKAVKWFGEHSREFRDSVIFLRYVRDNEYLIRNS